MEHVLIMPCLDIKDGRVVKGVQFVELQDAGDPVACARAYCAAGADELAFLDITATIQGRKTMLQTVRSVAAVTTVPFTVGGGIGSIADAEAVLAAGADRISMSSAAFRRPQLIDEAARRFGSERVVVAVDVDRNPELPSGYEVYVDGGSTPTGKDAVDWAREAAARGAGIILPTSKACDGTRAGYDLPLIRRIKKVVAVPVVASGGAGTREHFLEAAKAGADILLAASVFHFGRITIPELKKYLAAQGVPVKEQV
ncbi:MAG: imidazole glycerol phosphate synthase subunit HisF [Dethiobacteria bacterium]|jgi:cyclase|nr:imidazole glycerol phosphate synthase subunit HisF [Bacillota bacterium]HOP69715.1 imidazole glycerol phosphate synthase subunit HisF [Bacillota bacterium]HPT34859.1 imidazole glycerol phosphate synthase subunit HisF [Bacillota bacterium]HPZ64700.1 imidazole glycerol phosphate synthase subunit HisF [Bacillota bacterium]HQD05398.1 imidazole glycerol phosphate synthase subunit HisF [Bacillota bacterium]